MEIMEIILHPGFYTPVGAILYIIIAAFGYVFYPEDTKSDDWWPSIEFCSIFWPLGLAYFIVVGVLVVALYPIITVFEGVAALRKMRLERLAHKRRRQEEPKQAPYGQHVKDKSVPIIDNFGGGIRGLPSTSQVKHKCPFCHTYQEYGPNEMCENCARG